MAVCSIRMELLIEVTVAGALPPSGSRVIAQVRDTALQDAPATILGEGRGTIEGETGVVARVRVPLEARGRMPSIWVLVDVDGDGRVSRGDFVTTQSYPLSPGAAAVRVAVRKV